MLKRLLTLFVVVPIGIILIVLAVTNRQPVRIDVPPYVGDAPFFSFSVPLFALVFLAVLVLSAGFSLALAQEELSRLTERMDFTEKLLMSGDEEAPPAKDSP